MNAVVPFLRHLAGRLLLTSVFTAIAVDARAQAQAPDGSGAQSTQPRPVSYGTIVPQHAAQRDPSLTAFLDQLKAIVRARNGAAFLQMVSDDVAAGWSEKRGRGAFAKHWQIEDRNSFFWLELGRLLTLEGDDTLPGNYCLPYAWWHADDYDDPLKYSGVLVRADVPLRAAPSASAPVVTTLSYEVVTDVSSSDAAGLIERIPHRADGQLLWQKVQLGDGRSGYVDYDSYWSLIGLRIEMNKVNGRWRITVFVAGD